MERRKQILELLRRFDREFEASLAGLSVEEQLIVTAFLRIVVPIFIERSDGYYAKFYELYEKEILEKLRSKAKPLNNLKLTDYFVQDSLKLVDLQHELKIEVRNGNEQHLSDEEFQSFVKRALNQINLKHQALLMAEPPEGSPAKQLSTRSKPKNSTSQNEIRPGVDQDPEMQPLGDREEYMSIEECAKFLGRSKVTIHEYKKKGLPCFKLGRTIKFKKSEVLNFMRQQNRKSGNKRRNS
jgi:excisionase family DNA binding protein